MTPTELYVDVVPEVETEDSKDKPDEKRIIIVEMSPKQDNEFDI